MSHFREITGRDLRLLNDKMAPLADLRDIDEVERRFVHHASDLLPGDCVTWNNWTLDMSTPITSRANPEYETEIARLNEPLNLFVQHHPVIVGGGLPLTLERPQRMSDYQSYSRFKENPLFREVYRHVDANFQLGSTPSRHATGTVALTWNRRTRDFTERDQDLLHLIGRRLDIILQRLGERMRLERACAALGSALPNLAALDKITTLSNAEGRLLAGLLRGKSREEIARKLGWRRDTLDRRLALIRDRMGFENTGSLLRALAETKP